mmetsp:Transcript_87437/g.252457  ORF Transcript_87437/g.252457 Transcript_87437/m.252457 type:complete len:239 (-) Transcript_87437:49-765(-)
MIFIALVVVALSVLPMCLPTWIKPFLPMLTYVLLALALKKAIQIVLLDGLLVDDGEVTYPAIFSVFWFIQLVLNYVIGLSLAVARCAVVVLTSAVSCCLIDFSVVPECMIAFDTGYYSFLASVYTHHQNSNPVKSAFLTVVNGGRAHRVYGPASAAEPQTKQSSAAQRVRARMWLALTLHNNPELQQYRVKEKRRPQAMWCGSVRKGKCCNEGGKDVDEAQPFLRPEISGDDAPVAAT